MGKPDHPADYAGDTKKGETQMGIFEHDVRDPISFDDLNRPVQIP